MGERWLHMYAGRDILCDDGWVLDVALFPRRDLMAASEEGRLILVGLRLWAKIRWRSSWERMCHMSPRLRMTLKVHSDAEEIGWRVLNDARREWTTARLAHTPHGPIMDADHA